jgi:hypothetical protein
MDSWSKGVTRLLISRNENWEIRGSISEASRHISFDNRGAVFGEKMNFVEAVRQRLKDLAITVTEAIKTIKFAAVGARNLFDDEGTEAAEATPVFDNLAASSGLDRKVVSKFAALGQRTLDL